MKKNFSLCLLGLALILSMGFQDRPASYVPKKAPRPSSKQTVVNCHTNSNNILVLSDPLTIKITNQINPEWLKPPAEPFTLGPGDKLEIELLEDYTTRAIVPVGPDGKIYYSILPGIDVWGLTLSEARQ